MPIQLSPALITPRSWKLFRRGQQQVKSLQFPKRIQESHEVIRREGATPTNSNQRRRLVWESRPRDEGGSIPARPASDMASREVIFNPILNPSTAG
jgi:hypothetical protein